MKTIMRSVVWLSVFTGFALLLGGCQGINLYLQPKGNKVVLAFTSYAKVISGTSRSLSGTSGTALTPISKQQFMALKAGNTGSARLIDPRTAYYEIYVTAGDMEPIDAFYYASGYNSDFLDLYVPAGYARSFAIFLYDTNFTLVGSTEVVQDVVISPTLVDAVILPTPTYTLTGGYLPTINTPGWQIFKINFGTPTPNQTGTFNGYYSGLGGLDYGSGSVYYLFDGTGNEIPASRYLVTSNGTTNTLSGIPFTNPDLYGYPVSYTSVFLLYYVQNTFSALPYSTSIQ